MYQIRKKKKKKENNVQKKKKIIVSKIRKRANSWPNPIHQVWSKIFHWNQQTFVVLTVSIRNLNPAPQPRCTHLPVTRVPCHKRPRTHLTRVSAVKTYHYKLLEVSSHRDVFIYMTEVAVHETLSVPPCTTQSLCGKGINSFLTTTPFH